ncbi:DUF1648 domain-containing protein [Sporosarcina thermotolerans]|uniref:DUF1648 domain-containing protein n=1 Tax=Sporosarcina thermotolerans TaxID=633404 RepID=UPI0024BC6CBB|nr:DUF1648 domain-containing protein [Sporosarcina thermotolerans]WHT47694.1 DUF1648 domain-containing protein [Sporosarcina thermotolerans]
MIVSIFLAIIIFLTLIQAAIPRLLKKTIVFGVTIPELYVEDEKLSSYKKIYSTITLLVGLLGILLLAFWGFGSQLREETFVIIGLIIQFSILITSMILYLYFHIQTTKRKREMKWGENLKKVRVADLASRSNDEMLPSFIFALPMAITIGLIVYTVSQYSAMPDMIPTHWGPNGQPDAFSEKSPFSVIALLLILLVVQGMMVAINTFTKKSGVKLNAARRNSSRIQQLSFRKYTSWFMFLTTVLLTILFGFLQLTTIHGEFAGSMMMMVLPLGFFLIILLATAFYAFKVGQGGSRIKTEVIDEETPGITDLDDDQYWKAGVFYVNKNDPSIFVEKRFGSVGRLTLAIR